MDEFLASTIEVEKIMGEIGKMPFEPLKDEQEDEKNINKMVDSCSK
jgi:hypothetical protein